MKQRKTIFIDFDGTIINIDCRQYKIYQDVLDLRNIEDKLSKLSYLSFRRGGLSFSGLLEVHHGINDRNIIEKLYIEMAETPSYLSNDYIFPNVRTTLGELSSKYNLVLVSLRRKELNFTEQLVDLGIIKYFDQVLCVKGGGWSEKSSAIVGSDLFFPEHSYLVGDTEIDVLCAREAKIISIAIDTGLRSILFLESYCPNYLINNFYELKKIIN